MATSGPVAWPRWKECGSGVFWRRCFPSSSHSSKAFVCKVRTGPDWQDYVREHASRSACHRIRCSRVPSLSPEGTDVKLLQNPDRAGDMEGTTARTHHASASLQVLAALTLPASPPWPQHTAHVRKKLTNASASISLTGMQPFKMVTMMTCSKTEKCWG